MLKETSHNIAGMTLNELHRVKEYSYAEYCTYLHNKYSLANKAGLFKHHIHEDAKANLSHPKVAGTVEEKTSVVYCDYNEHLLLHILISEQTDARRGLGISGALKHISPEIKEYLDMGIQRRKPEYYQRIDSEVYKELSDMLSSVFSKTLVALDHNTTLYYETEYLLNTYNKALVVLGTGLGKTTTALEYLMRYKCRALVVTPNNVVKNGWERYSDYVDVTTYHSFSNNFASYDYSKYSLVIIDEAHHASSDVWGKGVQYLLNNNIKLLGLTATPMRTDGVDIRESLFDGCIAEGYSIEDGISDGIIHPFSYITSIYDSTTIEEIGNNCTSKELTKKLNMAVNNTPTVRNILASNMPMGKRKGVIFIQNVKDEPIVVDILKDAFPSVECRLIHHRMSDKEVASNRKWFEETDEGYLMSVNMVNEGAHYPGVNTLIMFRRTASYLLYSQQLGRIITLTRNPNPNSVVFDFVNNIESVDYTNRDTMMESPIKGILNALMGTLAFKSHQIIIKDEAIDIANALREIKDAINDKWCNWEDDIIKLHYVSDGAACCVALINDEWKRYSPENEPPPKCRTTNAIHHRASRLNISTKLKFSDDDNQFLIKNYSSKGPHFCAQKLGRTTSAIKKHAHELGLKLSKYLTDEEKELLRKHYYSDGVEWCSKALGRTKKSVSKHAVALGLSTCRKGTHVICVETGEIFYSMAQAGKRAGVSKSAISECLRGKTDTSGGFHWRYAEMIT